MKSFISIFSTQFENGALHQVGIGLKCDPSQAGVRLLLKQEVCRDHVACAIENEN